MLPDPEKTVLIVLGASTFNTLPDNYKEVFESAKNSMVDYFCDPLKGLELRHNHVFDRFNASNNKDDIIQEMNKFLRKKSPDDVFVFICSHGREIEKICMFSFGQPR